MSAALTRAASRCVRWLTSLGESRTRLVDKAVLLCPGSNRFRTALLKVSGAGDGIRTRDLLFTNSSPACKLVLVAAVFGFWHRARCEASQISRSRSRDGIVLRPSAQQSGRLATESSVGSLCGVLGRRYQRYFFLLPRALHGERCDGLKTVGR